MGEQAVKKIVPLSSQRSWLHSQWAGEFEPEDSLRKGWGQRSAALMKGRPAARPGASSRRGGEREARARISNTTSETVSSKEPEFVHICL